MAENEAVKINTRIIKFMVLGIVICGILGVLIYLADVDFTTNVTTVTPPVQPTLNTERATFKVMYPKMVSTSTEFIPVKDSTEKTTLKDSETDSTTQKTTTFQTEDPQEDFIYMGLNGPKVPIVKNSTIHTKESDCQSHCLAENCDFFVVKDSVCHLGYYGQNETYFLEGLISLFVSPDKISEEYSEQFEESLAYEDLLRSQQISSESGVTETQCLWNCIVTECQFYYLKNDICSLGQWKSGVQSDSNSQVQFHFKNIGNFTFDYTPMILHHDVSNLTKIEGEISLFSCLTRSYSLQHDFAVFDNGTCYIDGDLNKAQNSAINQSIQIQGYIKSGIKSSRQFDHIKIPKDVYSDLMTWDTFEDINDTDICAGICQAKSVSQCVAFYLENEVCYTSSEIKFGWTMQNDFSSELRTIYGKRNMEIDSEFLMRYPVQISKQTHTVKTIQSSSLWGCLVSCKWVDTCQGIYFENEICSLITEFPIQISPSQVQDLTVQDWESSNFYLKIFDTLQIANETGFKEKPREGYKKYECPANKFALVGNGHCDDASNVEECNWDNYECCGVVIQKGKCTECKCHRSGRQQLDIKEDLKCSLIHSGLTYIDNGICNQHVNYGECLLFDAGDCCDPRSQGDVKLSSQINFNNQCRMPESYIPHNMTFSLLSKVEPQYPGNMPEEFAGIDPKVQDLWDLTPNRRQRKLIGPRLMSAYASSKVAGAKTRTAQKYFFGNAVNRANSAKRQLQYFYDSNKLPNVPEKKDKIIPDWAGDKYLEFDDLWTDFIPILNALYE